MPKKLNKEKQNKECQRMREKSGNISSDSKLVKFIYILARDYLTTGQIEMLIEEHVSNHYKETYYTNGWLAEWSKDVAKRLQD